MDDENSPLRVALGEYDTGWHDPESSLQRAGALIRNAAAAGSRLVVLPEMCTTGFTMDAAHYSEGSGGPSLRAFRQLARESSLYIVAGMPTRETANDGERFYNSAFVITPEGETAAEYRKQRLFAYAREEEVYTAGDRPLVVTIGSLRAAVLICFDLRFPELFREVAPEVDAIFVIANWPVTRQSHWETLLRARAIESQAYVIGVNRLGSGGKLEYAGGSLAFGPGGETIDGSGEPRVVAIDPAEVTSARRKFPFVDDRRLR